MILKIDLSDNHVLHGAKYRQILLLLQVILHVKILLMSALCPVKSFILELDIFTQE